MPNTYHIPARFHAARSLVGRGICRYVDDPIRAENLYIAAVVLLGTSLIMIHFMLTTVADSWASGSAGWFWGVQIGLLLSYLAACFVGVQQNITVTCTDKAIEIERGDLRHICDYSTIEEVERISDELYYRHYRKYEETQPFVNRLPSTVLLLHTDDGPVALGLSESDQEELLETLYSYFDRSPILSTPT